MGTEETLGRGSVQQLGGRAALGPMRIGEREREREYKYIRLQG